MVCDNQLGVGARGAGALAKLGGGRQKGDGVCARACVCVRMCNRRVFERDAGVRDASVTGVTGA